MSMECGHRQETERSFASFPTITHMAATERSVFAGPPDGLDFRERPEACITTPGWRPLCLVPDPELGRSFSDARGVNGSERWLGRLGRLGRLGFLPTGLAVGRLSWGGCFWAKLYSMGHEGHGHLLR